MKNGQTEVVSGSSLRTGSREEVSEKISLERYKAFVENISEGVYEVDIHGNFVYFNDSLCRVFGFPREEIQSENFSRFMSEDYSRQAAETFNGILKTGKGISDLLWEITDKQGKIRIIELSADRFFNEEGKVGGFRGIARDITERFKTQRALIESEKQNRTLLDFIPYPMAVLTLDGLVTYLNPAFTNTFGWTLDELKGKSIPFVPAGLEQETEKNVLTLSKERIILRHQTMRLTKDGRLLDVVMRAAVFSEQEGKPVGELVFLRDITLGTRIRRNNAAMLRISMALPEYPDLDDLLNYISAEIKTLVESEGALVMLLDEQTAELFFKSASVDDPAAEKRMKEIRYPADKGVSGRVIRTGKPAIIPDTSKDPDYYSVVDIRSGFKTNNMLDVPLGIGDRIIGVLCAMNKKRGVFDSTDVELMNMIAGTVALYIERARNSEKLKEAYQEVSSLNRAKDKVINHLSHELRTPLAVLGASIKLLEKKLATVPPETWQPTVERARRNLDRILEMQYEVEDIMRERHYETHYVLSLLLMECADELETLVAEEAGEGPIVERIRKKIDSLFCVEEGEPECILLSAFVTQVLEKMRPRLLRRKVEIIPCLEASPVISVPSEPLAKVIVGLVRNAVENTPDGGRVELRVRKRGNGTEFVVHDCGIGITRENQKRIFEGFFSTQETMDYSSKEPFDFNAGGKGADLLRMKIFSERYNFKISMTSSRCRHLAKDVGFCPGSIEACKYCDGRNDCRVSGGTTFTVFFPPGTELCEQEPEK